MLEIVVVIMIVAGVAHWAFGEGKRLGSKKGFGAGGFISTSD